MDAQRYAPIQRQLHWAIAILVLGLLGAGQLLGRLGEEGMVAVFGETLTGIAYMAHMSLGILVLLLMFARVGVRLKYGKPAYAEPISPTYARLRTGIHHLFYLILIGMPIGGYLGTVAAGYPVMLFGLVDIGGVIAPNEALAELFMSMHALAGWLLLVMVVGHIGVNMYHYLVKQDSMMRRISLP